jgi:hypothetical protein
MPYLKSVFHVFTRLLKKPFKVVWRLLNTPIRLRGGDKLLKALIAPFRLLLILILLPLKGIWYLFYGHQARRRGHGWATWRLLLIWNITATGIVIERGWIYDYWIEVIFFWVAFFTYGKSYTITKRARSPHRKLPVRHRR